MSDGRALSRGDVFNGGGGGGSSSNNGSKREKTRVAKIERHVGSMNVSIRTGLNRIYIHITWTCVNVSNYFQCPRAKRTRFPRSRSTTCAGEYGSVGCKHLFRGAPPRSIRFRPFVLHLVVAILAEPFQWRPL